MGGDAVARVQKRLENLAECKIALLPTSGHIPGFFVAVDKARRAVVLGVRGTAHSGDVMTDCVGNSVPFPEYPGVETHQAILAAARAVLEKTEAALIAGLDQNPGFGIVVAGHSLGAGTAILCALLIKASPKYANQKLRCFAYAPPPIISPITDAAVRSVDICSVVDRHDIISRVSLHSVFTLGRVAVAIDKLDLGRTDRLSFFQKSATPAASEATQKIITAVTRVQEEEKTQPNAKYVAHLIPGEVFWIPDKEVSTWPLHMDSRNLQGLLIRGDMDALNDHKISSYRARLADLPPAVVTFPDSSGTPPVATSSPLR